MCSVKYIEKNIKKLSPEQMRFLNKGIDKLVRKIELKQFSGVNFVHIYNDDTVKYDKYTNSFYAVKFHTKSISMRVLYKVKPDADGITVEVHLVYIKKCGGSDYIKIFEEYSKKH